MPSLQLMALRSCRCCSSLRRRRIDATAPDVVGIFQRPPRLPLDVGGASVGPREQSSTSDDASTSLDRHVVSVGRFVCDLKGTGCYDGTSQKRRFWRFAHASTSGSRSIAIVSSPLPSEHEIWHYISLASRKRNASTDREVQL